MTLAHVLATAKQQWTSENHNGNHNGNHSDNHSDNAALKTLKALKAPFLLASRLYVAKVFFMAGLTKIADWETTLMLFTEEYHVPLLSPAVAAVLGTAGELVLPVLLVIGVCGRFAALGLSVVNVVAVIALSEIAAPALQQHVFWGWMLACLALVGVGQWSLDCWLKQRWLAEPTAAVPSQP